MTQEEKDKKDLLKEIEEQTKSLIEKSKEGAVDKSAIDKEIAGLNKKIEGLNDTELKALNDSVEKLVKKNEELEQIVEKQAETISKELENAKASKEPKTLKGLMRDAIMEKKDLVLTEKNDDFGKRLSLKEYFTEKGNQNSPTFVLKSAVDMLESNIVQANVSTIRLTELDPMRVGIPLTIYPHVIDAMPKKSISKPNMALLVVYDYTDGSATKTEGSAAGKSSFLFKTVSFPAFYIATYFTLSDETLDDLEETLDEINITAPDKINDKIDTKVLGTAGDDSTDIAGLFTANKHTDFDTTTYENTVENATIIDLIAKSKLQCETNKYRPDAVWMNPLDVDNLAALKNAIEDSVLDRRIVFNSLGVPVSIMGLRINISTAVTADTLAVVDSKQLMLGIRKDMEMVMGYNSADLTEGQKTVVIKIRLAFGVRDKAAVIYSDSIADDIVTINKSGA